YLLPGKVVNLDGVVNGEVYEAYRQRQWSRYVHQRNIRYIADFSAVIRVFNTFSEPGSMNRWLIVNQWPVTSGPGDFVILDTQPENRKLMPLGTRTE
ncbi:hypothetical protein ACFL27_27390, partial [candidate division CSSED10-310 bacterium]